MYYIKELYCLSLRPDNISPKFLKVSSRVFAIDNNEYFKSIKWALARVFLIFKAVLNAELGNYRPISVLLAVQKYARKFYIAKQVSKYCDDMKIVVLIIVDCIDLHCRCMLS